MVLRGHSYRGDDVLRCSPNTPADVYVLNPDGLVPIHESADMPIEISQEICDLPAIV